MKNNFSTLASTVLLVMTMQATAAPPPRHWGGGYRAPHAAVSGYRGHPVGHYNWNGGYRGPRVGIYYGTGFGYWSAWNYGWVSGYAVPYPHGYPFAFGFPVTYAPVVITSAPITQTYIQQEPAVEAGTPTAPTVNYWYYCTQPAGYFPYVQNCNQAWMKVIPPSPVNQQ